MKINTQQDQGINEVAMAVRQALLELQVYGNSHAVDGDVGNSIETLVAVGAFSPKTVAFIGSHQVRFHGFKPKPIRADIPVLEVVLDDRTTPLRFVGFHDGHGELLES